MAFSPQSTLGRLLKTPIRGGTVVWIGLRPARRAAVEAVQAARAVAGEGLAGDHYRTRRDGRRQVTLIAGEHLQAIASFLGCDAIDPAVLRRNIVTRGINLLALKGRRFLAGGALLEWSGECHPCSRMEEALGAGGYNAVRGHGGITARVVSGGEIRVGDAIEALS